MITLSEVLYSKLNFRRKLSANYAQNIYKVLF